MPCLFKERNILKSPDKIALENCLFINKYFEKNLLAIFQDFTFCQIAHPFNTRLESLGCRIVPSHKSKLYGRNYFNISSIDTCNTAK